ncbi:MAG: ABC transporter permease subunit [Armatimonadota bacterium]|nr:ABC transporter permease subunit [Armatimonadota bacterium]MDW8156859.1 ABC transporter permease subunit [Armatimonadota bacterium]
MSLAIPHARRARTASYRRSVWVLALRASFVLGVLVGWAALSGDLVAGWRTMPRAILPSPTEVLAGLRAYAASGDLAGDALYTLSEAGAGLALAIAAGITVGVLFAYVRLLGQAAEPLMVALNAMPRYALAPLFVVWFGLGMASKVALVFFAVFFVVFFNVYQGVLTMDANWVRAIEVMGGGPREVARYVILPYVVSWVVAALRTSIGVSLGVAVVGEFVGSVQGLGYRMVISVGVLDTPRTFAILVVLAAVGYGVVTLAGLVERRLLRWQRDG